MKNDHLNSFHAHCSESWFNISQRLGNCVGCRAAIQLVIREESVTESQTCGREIFFLTLKFLYTIVADYQHHTTMRIIVFIERCTNLLRIIGLLLLNSIHIQALDYNVSYRIYILVKSSCRSLSIHISIHIYLSFHFLTRQD